MFNWCDKLTQAPRLPATELAERCYLGMFFKCESLTQVPELPATELAENCYDGMFGNCIKLTKAPELPATKLAKCCYETMFDNCTSLIQAPKLPATELDKYCYERMFHGCTSLTQAPELPATELTDYCYYMMFYKCEKLQKIKISFTEWTYETYSWVYQVAPTGTFYCPKGLPLEYGEGRIPEGWNVEYIDDGSDVAEHVSDASIKAWGADVKITYIGASLPVEIYDLSGRLVKKVKEESQSVVMPQHGTYVVKTGTVSLKVEL